jgi:hypothetical protein
VIVESHAAIVVLAAAIFFAVALGGLAILRRQQNVAVRSVLFLVFSYACVWFTLWIARRGRLHVGEAAAAWIVALLLVAVVEALRSWRKRRIIT